MSWFRLKERLVWRIAYLLPRPIALIAFIRVYAVLGTCGEDYKSAYDAWERGAGR